MQRLDLRQTLGQRLSPQQIQFIKLLQVPTVALEARVKNELESNPALEDGPEEELDPYDTASKEEEEEPKDELNLEEYLHDDYSGYKTQADGRGSNEEEKEMPIATVSTLSDALKTQVGFMRLDDRQRIIVLQLVGSIESDGYIRRETESIVNDLAFAQGVETDIDEVEELLRRVQLFDPPGIGARNLQECLLLQLERKEAFDDSKIILAKNIIENYFDKFTKKHYKKIISRLNISEAELKEAIEVITKLNPKPGGAAGNAGKAQQIVPDYLISNDNGKLQVTLNSRNAPELRVSRSYSEMFDAYDKSDKKDKKMKETISFVKQKLDSAKWFIDAIKQRQATLLRTMNAIVRYQYDYFQEGDESKLRPMILKDIAEKIEMDISTVSRVANSKAVQTDFGIFPLKYFFSESITTDTGEDVSSREVKHILKKIIDGENKSKPFSDDKIEKQLREKGYNIARRTVAKYREQLNIPVARLRKEL